MFMQLKGEQIKYFSLSAIQFITELAITPGIFLTWLLPVVKKALWFNRSLSPPINLKID